MTENYRIDRRTGRGYPASRLSGTVPREAAEFEAVGDSGVELALPPGRVVRNTPLRAARPLGGWGAFQEASVEALYLQ